MTCFSEFLTGACNCSIYRNSSLHTKPTGTDPLSSRGAIFRGSIKWFSATFHRLLLFKRRRHSWVQKTVLNRNSPIFTRVLKKQSVCGADGDKFIENYVLEERGKRKTSKQFPLLLQVWLDRANSLTAKHCAVWAQKPDHRPQCAEKSRLGPELPWEHLGLQIRTGVSFPQERVLRQIFCRPSTQLGEGGPLLRAPLQWSLSLLSGLAQTPIWINRLWRKWNHVPYKRQLWSHICNAHFWNLLPWNEGQASHVQKVPQWGPCFEV